MKDILRFVDFLNKIYKEEKVCVFYSLSGHVNWFEFSVAYSKKAYSDVLFSGMISGLNTEKEKDIKKQVDKAINDIKKIIKNLKSERRKVIITKVKEEKKELERLKEKYEK